ncbi:MAG: 4Fe-4S dicluster domain-containing protein [Candidatus Omnitrophota bacterium]
MAEIYYSQTSQWEDFLSGLKQSFRIYLPKPKDDDYLYQESKDSIEYSFNSYRPVQPVKSFFFHPKEKAVTDLFSPEPVEDVSPTVVVGLKNCDLHSLKLQDFVFAPNLLQSGVGLGQEGTGFKEGIECDALYESKRKKTILISGDCTGFKEVCFCLALGVLPHPVEGFDLNLSPLTGGFLLEVGSVRGKELIEKYKKYFIKAKDSQLSARDSKRQNLIDELNNRLKEKGLPDKAALQKIVKDGYNSQVWHNFCLTCVECGACNFICCTCHCFLLSDVQEKTRSCAQERDKDKYPRLRVWDSCQYANFSRVAGGANPLKRRAARLRNRFLKKFDFFVDNMGVPACEGCGRCIEACPGKIDIREVLKDLAKNA